MTSKLPIAKSVDVATLGRIFSNTTNSYKLVFFQAILNLFQQECRQNQPCILPLDELAVEMAAISWYPIRFFHVSFGIQDKMHEVINRLHFQVEEVALANRKTQRDLRYAIRAQAKNIGLSRLLHYVPYRLLEPFFNSKLRGLRDVRKNTIIRELAEVEFNTIKPLYRFHDSSASLSIEIHPIWERYFSKWYEIIRGWCAYKWIEYLQARNPNVPAIPNKIIPPLARASLRGQADYWRSVMNNAPVICLYSGNILDESNFALDHFIPWSFVCHDQLWNLVPVLPQANASKSNNLPDNQYIDCFIELQTTALQVSYKNIGKRKWSRLIEDFIGDLRMAQDDLLDANKVRQAYLSTLPAMLSLAEQTGFSPGWIFRGKL